MTEEDKRRHEQATHCHICRCELGDDKVADHSHIIKGGPNKGIFYRLHFLAHSVDVVIHSEAVYSEAVLLAILATTCCCTT